MLHIHVEQAVEWDGMSGTCKEGMAHKHWHTHVEQSVGWGGMIPFPGTCKARMAHEHWRTYTLNKGVEWGGMG